MSGRFAHLNLHSEYSVGESIIRIDPLMEHAAQNEAPAVAVTDTGNLFSAVKVYRSAIAHGVKPIIGCELPVGDAKRRHNVVFLCRNNKGYRDLVCLVSKAYVERRSHDMPWAEYDWLAQYGENLIVLSGAADGDIGDALLAGDDDVAHERAQFWASTFKDRFYLEMRQTGRDDDAIYLSRAFALAREKSLPVVATNRVCFLKAEDFRAHDVRVCIERNESLDDTNRVRLYTEEQYFKTEEAMKSLFKKCPEAIENSVEISKRCTVRMKLGGVLLPAFPTPKDKDADTLLREEAQAGLKKRLQSIKTASPEAYEQRLESELQVISDMKYAGYFLIVADFVRWARGQDIPVGPGRGSGAGSLAAYALGITEIDPMPYKLLFERFLNPERISMPDFDIDFCTDRRDRVIEYVTQFYGAERVSQIITFGTMAARAVVRDVGRVFGCPYSMMDKIAKLIPGQPNMKLETALESSPELKDECEKSQKIREVIDVSLELEGLVRNVGCHAGGVVISPDPLTEHSALYRESPTTKTLLTHLDMNDLERVGLVKFDFLGLNTLTVIDKAVKDLASRGVEVQAMNDLAPDDEKTYRLMQEGRTSAIFQLESEGIRRLLRDFKPDCFDDLVAVLAIYRPGPLQSGMVKDFIQGKNGGKISYPHAKLEPVLKPTYGVFVYQEQVMESAQILAGYTMGEADILRRAMGKKKPEEMAEQREIFVNNAVELGTDRKQATHIFDLMEKFAGYGFNKSHSVAYALVAYQTAWLKTHHGASFMAATMSLNMSSVDKMVSLIHECRSMGIQVERPDINRSEWDFTVEGDGRIRYGLGAIRTLGSRAVQAVADERRKNGDYASLEDFCMRVGSEVRKNMVEVLVRAGAFDELGERAAALTHLPAVYAMAEQSRHNESAGQDALFSGDSAPTLPNGDEVEALPPDESIKMEKDVLGLYIGRHPLDKLRAEIRELKLMSLQDMRRMEEGDHAKTDASFMTAGVITNIRQRQGRRGRAAIFTLDDNSGRLDFLLGGKPYDRCGDLLVHEQIVVVEAGMHFDSFNDRRSWRAKSVQNLDDIRRARGKQLAIVVDDAAGADFCDRLRGELERFRGGGSCPVRIEYHRADASARIDLGREWAVSASNEIVGRLRRIEGVRQVKIMY